MQVYNKVKSMCNFLRSIKNSVSISALTKYLGLFKNNPGLLTTQVISWHHLINKLIHQWRIQDFPEGHVNSRVGCVNLLFVNIFAKNCLKKKKNLDLEDASAFPYHQWPSCPKLFQQGREGVSPCLPFIRLSSSKNIELTLDFRILH